MDDDEVEQCAAEYRRLLDERKRIDEDREKIRARLIDALGRGQHSTDNWVLRISRNDWVDVDKQRLKAALGDRYEEYTTTRVRWRLDVKRRQQG